MSAIVKIEAPDLTRFGQQAEELGNELTGDTMKARLGQVMYEQIRGHFEQLTSDSAHHKTAASLGAAPTGFYEKAADATQAPEIEPEGVSVSITGPEGITQRYYGGTISAKTAGALTIPARAEAYGRRAGEFDNLKLIVFPSGKAALVAADETGGQIRQGPSRTGGSGRQRVPKSDAKGNEVYFWLVKSVEQSGDASILPTDAEILEPAAAAAGDYIDILRERLAA